MKKSPVILLALSLMMSSGAALADSLFKTQCAGCHSTQANVKQVGKSLFGIIGSQTALSGDSAWNAASLDVFLSSPDSVRMMRPVSDATARTEIIAYLETLK